MKKIASLLIALSLVFAFAVSAFALTGENYALFSASSDVDIPINEHLGGDVNGDGMVSVFDALAAIDAVINNGTCPAGDMNMDNTLSLLDVLQILKKTAE